jgi:hypothetical protein
MKHTALATGATLIVGIAIGVGLSNVKTLGQAPPSSAPHMTAEQYDAMFKDNNNWGRWGKDDKLGTLNLLTDAKRKQAAALVKSGISVSLEHDLSTEAAPDNPNPLKLEFGPTFRRTRTTARSSRTSMRCATRCTTTRCTTTSPSR